MNCYSVILGKLDDGIEVMKFPKDDDYSTWVGHAAPDSSKDRRYWFKKIFLSRKYTPEIVPVDGGHFIMDCSPIRIWREGEFIGWVLGDRVDDHEDDAILVSFRCTGIGEGRIFSTSSKWYGRDSLKSLVIVAAGKGFHKGVNFAEYLAVLKNSVCLEFKDEFGIPTQVTNSDGCISIQRNIEEVLERSTG